MAVRPTGFRYEDRMNITGGCFCGSVRFEADVDPEQVVVCHCKDCQRLSGSPYRVSVLVSRDNIALSGGVTRDYWKMAESGEKRAQTFCETCGGPVFSKGEGEAADQWVIRWGMIDQRDQLPPKRQIWCRSAASWAGDLSAFPGEKTE